MRRFALFLLLVAPMVAPEPALGQSAPTKVPRAPAPQKAQEQALAPEVEAAEAAIVKSDWKTAATRLDAWLVVHPVDARALFDAGYVAEAQNRVADATGYYGRAVAADPRSFESRLMYGLVLARQGKLEEARPQLAAATALDPGEAGPAMKARAWRALARIDEPQPGRAGDAALASSELLEALKLTPETTEDTLLAASLAESQGQNDAAEAAYRRVLEKDSKSAAANAGLAHLLMEKKQYPEAETLLESALKQSPDDAALNAQLATALAAQDKPEALPLLNKLHAAHPADEAITRMLADMMAETGDAAGSDKLYVELLAAHPDDIDLLIAHGQDLTRQLKYAAAMTVFNKATEVDATSGDAWSGLAFAALKVGQPSVTLHALTIRSKYLPEVPATLFLWAMAYDTLHEKLPAASYYHQFLKVAGGKFPDQEWQARQRLKILEKKP